MRRKSRKWTARQGHWKVTSAMADWQEMNRHPQRRRHTRRTIRLTARLEVQGRQFVAVAENISPGGAFLRVELPPDAAELVASIGLPHGRELKVRAKVRWRRVSPPGAGVEFETFLRSAREDELRGLV